MVKLSNNTKVQIILSVVLWIAGAVILLGGTAISFRNDNALSTIAVTGAIVLFGIISSVRKDKLAMLKPQLVRKK